MELLKGLESFLQALKDWVWVGVIGLPFGILTNWLYDVLVKGGKTDRDATGLARLGLPLTEEERALVAGGGTVLAMAPLFFHWVGVTLIKNYSDQPPTLVGQWIGFIIGFAIVLFIVYLAVGLTGIAAVGGPLWLGLSRRFDVFLYVLLVGVLTFVLLRAAKDARGYVLAWAIAFALPALLMALIRLPRVVLRLSWNWAMSPPAPPSAPAARSPAAARRPAGLQANGVSERPATGRVPPPRNRT